MNRTAHSIRNIKYALLGQIIALVVSLVSRVIFIRILGNELLGISGLFTNILTVISLVELGIGPAFSFSLYRPIFDNDTEKIKSLMRYFKVSYSIIGIVILLIGLALLPFYTFFISNTVSIENLDIIFLLFILNASISYFYSYKKSLIAGYQLKYIVTFYRYLFFIILNILQITSLFLWHNYLIFLSVQIAATFLENVFISIRANKMFPFLKEGKGRNLEKDELKEIRKNVGAMMMHKIGGVLVLSTDNILISKIVGLLEVAKYANYYLIIQAIQNVFIQFFTALTASIGHLYVENDRKSLYNVFTRIQFANFWIYGVSSIAFFTMFNYFISIWVGVDFVFTQNIVFIIVLNFYLLGMRRTLLTFKEATGVFYNDRYRPLLEVVFNLGFSIFLGIRLGIIGILLGTAISSILSSWIEPVVVYRHILHRPVKEYFFLYFQYLFVLFLIGTISHYILLDISINKYLLFIINSGMIFIISNLVLLIIYAKTDNMKFYINLAKENIKSLLRRKTL